MILPAVFAEALPGRNTAVATFEVMLVLLSVVAALALLARKVQLPYPILLVVGGLAISFIPSLPRVRLDPELVFVLFLPPLLYPAALFTPWRDFYANIGTILLLAIGLVLFTMVATAWFAHHFIGLGWGPSYVLGAIVAPSDAVAAVAIGHRLRVPRQLITVLDGESLVNDTTAFVAYRFAVAAVVTGTFSATQAAMKFVVAGAGGIMVGLVFGWLITEVQRRLDDPPVQITLSILTPFACYLAADAIDTSGVLAVVVCGLYYGWRAPEFIRASVRLRAYPVWEMIGFVLNGVIFILIGLQLPDVLTTVAGRSWHQMLWFAAIIVLAVIGLRLVWLFAFAYAPRILGASWRRRFPAPPWQDVAVMGWTGMRGVDSLAAALAVPLVIQTGAPFPGRDVIFFLTFAVIFGTLVLQGLSLAPLIRWLGVRDDRAWEKEETRARLKANQAALARVIELTKNRPVAKSIALRLTTEYEDRILQLETETQDEAAAEHGLFSEDFARLSQEAINTERQTILQLRNRREINDDALRRIQRDIDLAETRLRRGES